MSASPETDWIPWNGNEDGKCPLPDGTKFEVKFRCGETYTRTAPAWFWSNGSGRLTIVAYRILSTPKQPWTLAEHCAKYWPTLDISKVHMASAFVEGDLEDGEGPVLASEIPQGVDRYWSDMFNSWMPAGNCSRTASDEKGWPDTKIKTRRPLPDTKPVWTLSEYLRTNFPDWGDSKPHREDGWVEEHLSGGWRPLLQDEPIPDDAEHTTSSSGGGFIKTKPHESVMKREAEWCWIRTRRPLPSAQLEPPAWSKGWHNPAKAKEPGEGYRFLLVEEVDGRFGVSKSKPSVADHYYNHSRGWWNGYCDADRMEETYRVPASTPLPSPPEPVKAPEPSAAPDLTAGGITSIPTQDEAMRFLETILPIAQNEPEQPTENNTMNTASTLFAESPAVGSRYAMKSADGRRSYKATVIGISSQGVALNDDDTDSENKTVVITPDDWSTRPKALLPTPTKRELKKQVKAAAKASRTGPGPVRRVAVGAIKAASWMLLGVILKTPLTHAAVGGIAYLTGLLSK